jgi:hypothetical protein
MRRGNTSRGTQNCRKSTIPVDSIGTMLVISTALQAQCCVLNHQRNGYLRFINRSPLIQ